jgi:hypothetical protein
MFNYDVEDTERIPGLRRPWDRGVPFLTPVFFKREVLVHYFYTSGYNCQLCSETYGTVAGKDFDLAFGINPNGNIVAWLGDLENLPEREKHRFVAENIPSDGDIKSEFYDGQIGCMFTEPIIEITVLNNKYKANRTFHNKYGKFLYRSSEPDVGTLINRCSRYKRIMFNSEDDFKRFISEWSEALVEDLDQTSLKKAIRNGGTEPPAEFGSIKLLEFLLVNLLGDPNNTIAPLFYLYDLRIWSDHSGGDSKFQDVCNALGVSPAISYHDLYREVMKSLDIFFIKFNSLLES